jgi:uncharacterized membrane protein YfcA
VTLAELVLFGAVVALGYLVQTVTGFGSMVVCITLGALILPLEALPVIMVPLSLAQNAWITVRHRREVEWKLIFRTLLPLMLVGMAAGFAISGVVRGPGLKIAFGVLVLLLSSRELFVLVKRRDEVRRPMGRPRTIAALLGAGVLHGIYATGGPLLVYAVGRLPLGKAALRATLTTMWLLLNAALTAMMIGAGRATEETLLHSAYFLPAIPVGIGLGELLHHRVDERRFRILLFALLAGAATVLIVH